jgi:uncharacterized repeat protein (TIGR03803 family)
MKSMVSANFRTLLFKGTVSALLLLAVTATGSAETRLPKRFHGERPFHPIGMPTPNEANAAAAAPADTREVVLHDFVSPPHGAYPATGVIRDAAGNLYGATNGAYSDVGGGGAHNAGVVFKVDTAGCETVLYSFTGGADGSSPNGVILDSAGNLYGTTSGGGAAGAGVVFKIDTSGHETVLYSFTGGADGASPNIVVRGSKGDLYGTTYSGGALGAGVVFKIDTSGHEKVLYTFTGGADGGQPFGAVTLDSAGNFYGTTDIGGTSDSGVVFKVDKSGHETVLYTFTGGADGASPNGVIRDLQGNLYGTTTLGGGASGVGVVFKVDKSGHETVLYSFTGGNDGGSSYAGVVLDAKGNLYGTTDDGGASQFGVVFKVDKSGHETVLHTFSRGPEGNQPFAAGVILDPAGNLYGTTDFSGAGGQGAVYKLDTSGNATVVYAFPGAAAGQFPFYNGVIFASDRESDGQSAGHLYGTTFYGGSGGAGVLYQLDEDCNKTVLYSFSLFTAHGFGYPVGGVIRDSAGNFYGGTAAGQTDVGYGYGVVYKVDTAGHATVLHNFTDGADGGYLYGSMLLDAAGNLYGTTYLGGASGAGVVFKIDTSGDESVLYSFTGGTDGGYPVAGVIRDAAGNLYGTTYAGGASNAGVVFKIDTSGNESVLYSFTAGTDGGYPSAGVISDAAGNLYGTTSSGGAAYAGVVYKVDMSGNESVLYSFTGGADGGHPGFAGVVLDSAGNLYGTTAGGGNTLGAGVVYKVDMSGKETVLYTFTGGADGNYPNTGVILGPNGKLYGTTAFGGRANAGVVFEIKP